MRTKTGLGNIETFEILSDNENGDVAAAVPLHNSPYRPYHQTQSNFARPNQQALWISFEFGGLFTFVWHASSSPSRANKGPA